MVQFHPGILKEPCHSLLVLCVLFFVYLLNQADRFIFAVVGQDLEESIGFGDGKGGGLEYDLLAGPVFIMLYVLFGIPVALAAERYNRRNILLCALTVWSCSSIAMALCTKYWHLVMARAVQGIGESGCSPIAASLMVDIFSADTKGEAMAIYSWAIYFGSSIAFGAGNLIKSRWGYKAALVAFGSAGLPVACAVVLLIQEPTRTKTSSDEREHNIDIDYGATDSVDGGDNESESTGEVNESDGTIAANGGNSQIRRRNGPPLTARWRPERVKKTRHFLQQLGQFLFSCRKSAPFWALSVAGGVRNSAGYIWAYKQEDFLTKDKGLTPDGMAQYLSWIPLVFGPLGALLGGYTSDLIAHSYGPRARVWALVGSQALAAPFAFGVVLLPAPVLFVCLALVYLLGEAWVGIALALATELIPRNLTASSVSVYIFIISVLGGNAILFVSPLQNALGGSLQDTLLIVYPGLYICSALLFAAAWMMLKWQRVQESLDISRFRSTATDGGSMATLPPAGFRGATSTAYQRIGQEDEPIASVP